MDIQTVTDHEKAITNYIAAIAGTEHHGGTPFAKFFF